MRWTLPLLLAIAPLAALHAAPAGGLSVTLLSGKNSNTTSWNSSGDDWRRVQALRRGNEPLLYVRQGGSAYVIRDAGVLARADAIMKPQRDLGARQGALGAQQGELGRRQGMIGAEQGRLGARMADASVRRSDAVAAQMEELGRRQAALGAQQEALGRRQSALGAEQSRLAERARPQFEALVADAIRRGLAERVN